MANPFKSKKSGKGKSKWSPPWLKKDVADDGDGENGDESVRAKRSTVQEVKRAARSAGTAAQLLSILAEEHIFSPGQPVYIAGSMGLANVSATFKRMGAGGMAIVTVPNTGEVTVMPHQIYPSRK